MAGINDRGSGSRVENFRSDPDHDPQKRIAIRSFDHGSKDPNALPYDNIYMLQSFCVISHFT